MENKGSKIIQDYLEDRLTEQEKARLETWYLLRAEQSEHSDSLNDFEQIGGKMWNRIENILEPRRNEQRKTVSFFRTALFKMAVAASLLIAASTAYFLLKDTSSPERFTIAKEKDINPGKNKAYLTLSDGRKIDLTEASAGAIASESGLQLSKAADGTLIYKASTSGVARQGYNNISTPMGGQYMVVLPDGSKVWLNAGSSLRYPTDFESQGRAVTLSGEGYFEVAHVEDKNGRLPFLVTIRRSNGEQATINVLGTHFNVSAYDDEPLIRTTLLKGSVKMDAGNGNSVMLKPGQQSTVNHGKIQLGQADTEMAIAWKNGDFVFREDLQSAMRKVARWYDLEVIYDPSAPKQLMLGGWMSRARNLSEVLDHIQLTGKVHFKLEGRRVTVFN